MARAILLLLAAALLAAPAAASATTCRTDRLGNTICLGAGPEPELARPPFVRPSPEPPALVPSWREDAFGTVRPFDPTTTGPSPFGTPPRPEPRTRCRTDSFGSFRCP